MEEETREDRQKRNEQNSRAILIRSALENVEKLPDLLPMLSPETKQKISGAINEFLPKIRELLPIAKDEIKSAIANQSEKMGAGEDKIAYVFRNGETGLEIWTLKNPKFGGEKVSVFSFKKITDRIDKYQKVEALIGDLISGRLFSDKDYFIDTTPIEKPTTETKQFEQPKE